MPARRTTPRPFANRAYRNVLQATVEVPAVVRLLDVPPRARVLEVGCGRGVALTPLAHLLGPARLVGLDADAALLAHADAPAGAELVHADVRRIPFPEGTFDVVVDFGTVHHVEEPAVALREIARVLAPGGLFVHETRAAQLLAHPLRASRRALPWDQVPQLLPGRTVVLWSRRVRAAEPRPIPLSFGN